jgi:hypothetical protein
MKGKYITENQKTCTCARDGSGASVGTSEESVEGFNIV